MTAPALFLGTRDGNLLLEANVGSTDAAAPFAMRCRTNRLAPMGLTKTATFSRVNLTVTYQDAQALTVRLFVDDALVATRTITLPQLPELRQRVVWTHFSVPLMVGGVERGRLHPRGTWCQLEVETDGAAAVAIDGAEIEWDPAGER